MSQGRCIGSAIDGQIKIYVDLELVEEHREKKEEAQGSGREATFGLYERTPGVSSCVDARHVAEKLSRIDNG
jgi:hypothetical protein